VDVHEAQAAPNRRLGYRFALHGFHPPRSCRRLEGFNQAGFLTRGSDNYLSQFAQVGQSFSTPLKTGWYSLLRTLRSLRLAFFPPELRRRRREDYFDVRNISRASLAMAS
jgi:hypothetical protein